MKKFWAAILFSLTLVLSSCVPAHAAEVSAAPQMQTAVNVTKVAQASPGGVVQAAPQFNVSAPKLFQGRGIAPTYYVLFGSCYLAMDGSTWCYRYSCTTWEYWMLGCRDGWFRYSNYWWA